MHRPAVAHSHPRDAVVDTQLPDGCELSEFSVHEVLYMGSDAMTFFIENNLGSAYSDPFDILAALEEHAGTPLAKQETPM